MTRVSIIVAALVVTVACASSPTRREVVVDFLSVRGLEGNTTPALVSVEENRTDRIRVGVLEGSALQLSGQWRTSVWLAALQASLTLDRPLSDWTVWVEAIRNGERFDGPSAGGLLTAGILAGMTGQKADPRFTMTGTINPDGTIGPVGGIPQKFQAAIRAGKTTLGYPMGQQTVWDMVTNREMDVRALAQAGVHVVEIPDVEAAYGYLTGVTLVQPKPVAPQAMTLPPKIEGALRTQCQQWLASTETTFNDFSALGVKDPELDGRWRAVDMLYAETKRFLDDGEVAAAYALANQLFIDADTAYLRGRVVQHVRAGRFDEANNFTQSVIDNVDKRLAETSNKMKSALAKSASDLMSLTAAFEALGSAVRHFFRGFDERKTNQAKVDTILMGLRAGRMQPTPELTRELIDLLDRSLVEVAAANVHNFVAGQNLDFRPDVRAGVKEIPARRIQRLGQLLVTAGNANISYFEQTTLTEIARAHGVTLDVVKANFGDPTYRLLHDDIRATAEVAFISIVGEGPTLDMVRLAGALSAYVGAAVLIAKYYSLEGLTNDRGEVQSLGRGHVLPRMLELAEMKARIHAARAAKLAGEIPVAARVAYQIGRSWQNAPSVAARMQALEQYWRASMLSQMAVLLNR
jgi:uncharacterized protein